MGGKLFQPEGLMTPRMPPSVYYGVLGHIRAKLKSLYSHIESPIEAPEKHDHGDIDIFVISVADVPPSVEEVVAVLGATSFKYNKPTLHLAIPWPENDRSPNKRDPQKSATEETGVAMGTLRLGDMVASGDREHTTEQSLHIQIDICVCQNLDELEFALFMHNHGDLLSILGGMIRRFGLTCSNSGVHIRIAELESFNKNLARYKILERPKEILEYLGMDEKRFWQPFTTWEECMDYAATCRFHDPAKGKKHDDIEAEMNTEDRRRVSKRSMFSYWIETYLPSHRDDPAGRSSHMSREEVLEEAKLMFGEDFAKSFEHQRASGIRQMQEQQLWADVRRETKAAGSQLTYAMKGLKREITTYPDDEAFMSDVQKDYVAGRFDRVKTWSLANWMEVGVRQERLDKDKSAQKFLAKLAERGDLRP